MKKILLSCLAMLPAASLNAAETVAVAPNVELIPGTFEPDRQPDGNSVLFRTPDGWVVFDTGRHPEHTQKILDRARDSGLPIKAVINSHWHLDHIGGNPRIRAAYPDVRVYASLAIDGAMSGFLAKYRAQLVDAIAGAKEEKTAQSYRDEIAIIDSGRALYPDQPIGKTSTQRIAGHVFELHLQARAVTAGDVWIYDPETRTLAAGDLVTLPVPLLDTACPTRWKSALDDLGRASFKTLIPGHGAPMQRAQFDVYRHAYANLLRCAASSQAKSVCIDGWIADAGSLTAEGQRSFARTLLDYYVDHSLRATKDAAEACSS
jgi:glyoxylase-like metal-dependent hydrolase (beta-lactamase superfamily II)